MNILTKSTALAVAFTGIFSTEISAQHCALDGAEIVVVNVTPKGGNTVIPNLKITVLDSAGNTDMTQLWIDNHWVDDTVKFW